jgi:5-deoxy-glucuronate isomerase
MMIAVAVVAATAGAVIAMWLTGTPGQARHLSICLGRNVQAGRLIAGFTFSEPGNWTSWPPHEHAAMLEEMYVYFNMPAPAFGIQMVYNNTEYPELLVPVREGDAVLIPAGYHPNVSVPGHSIGFLWAMAAHREEEDRQFGVVNDDHTVCSFRGPSQLENIPLEEYMTLCHGRLSIQMSLGTGGMI